MTPRTRRRRSCSGSGRRCGTCTSSTPIRAPPPGPGTVASSWPRGDLLAFLDADDLWMPDKLQRQIAALAATPRPDLCSRWPGSRQPGLDEAVRRTIHWTGRAGAGVLGSMLLPRTVFDRIGRFDERWRIGEPLDWYLRVTELGLTSVVCQDVLLLRRLHTANQGMTKRDARADYARILKHRSIAGLGPSRGRLGCGGGTALTDELAAAWRCCDGYFRGSYGRLMLSLPLSVGQTLTILPITAIVRHAFDATIPAGDVSGLLFSGASIVALYVANVLFTLASRHLVLDVTKRHQPLRVDMLHQLYECPWPTFQEANTGQLHSAVVQDTERLDMMANALVGVLLPAAHQRGPGRGLAPDRPVAVRGAGGRPAVHRDPEPVSAWHVREQTRAYHAPRDVQRQRRVCPAGDGADADAGRRAVRAGASAQPHRGGSVAPADAWPGCSSSRARCTARSWQPPGC